MEKIAELKNRISLMEKLFDNSSFKGYECFEKVLLHTDDYKEYFLVSQGFKSDTLEESFLKAISGENPLLHKMVSFSPSSIRFQYEENKKELEELENGND